MMIEVPTPLVSLSPFKIINGKNGDQFKEYIEAHPFSEKKEFGFTGKFYLEKGRLSSLMLFPLEEVRYDVVLDSGEIKYCPKSLKYVNKALIIYNENGFFEIVGMNSKNKSIIKKALDELCENLNLTIEPHPIFTLKLVSYLLKLNKNQELTISRLAYNIQEAGEKIKRYEFASDLSRRLIEMEQSHPEILGIAGETIMTGTRMSFIIRKGGSVIVYNKIKTPLIWNDIFQFIDNIIYMEY